MADRDMREIERTQAELDALCAQRDNCVVDHAAAVAEHKAAEDALEHAIGAALSGATVNKVALHRAAADAAAAVQFNERLLGRLQEKIDHARVARIEAEGESYRPIYDAGRAVRLEAAKRGDAARAELEAASKEFHRGTAMIQSAYALRCKHPESITSDLLVQPLRTEADERQLWAAVP